MHVIQNQMLPCTQPTACAQHHAASIEGFHLPCSRSSKHAIQCTSHAQHHAHHAQCAQSACMSQTTCSAHNTPAMRAKALPGAEVPEPSAVLSQQRRSCRANRQLPSPKGNSTKLDQRKHHTMQVRWDQSLTPASQVSWHLLRCHQHFAVPRTTALPELAQLLEQP